MYNTLRALLNKKVITKEIFSTIVQSQILNGKTVCYHLVRQGFINENDLVNFLHQEYSIPIIDHDTLLNIPEETIKIITHDMAVELRAIPVKKQGKELIVIMSDPGDNKTWIDIMNFTGFKVSSATALESYITEAIENYYEMRSTSGEHYLSLTRVKRKSQEPENEKTQEKIYNEEILTNKNNNISNKQEYIDKIVITELENINDGSNLDDRKIVQETFLTKQKQTLDFIKPIKPVTQNSELNKTKPPMPPPPPKIIPKLSIEDIKKALNTINERDDVIKKILDFLNEYFNETGMFAYIKSDLQGKLAKGKMITTEQIQKIKIPIDEISTFKMIYDDPQIYWGRLGQGQSDILFIKYLVLNPKEKMLLWPILIKGKTVSFFWGYNVKTTPPSSEILQEISVHISSALERIIKLKKI